MLLNKRQDGRIGSDECGCGGNATSSYFDAFCEWRCHVTTSRIVKGDFGDPFFDACILSYQRTLSPLGFHPTILLKCGYSGCMRYQQINQSSILCTHRPIEVMLGGRFIPQKQTKIISKGISTLLTARTQYSVHSSNTMLVFLHGGFTQRNALKKVRFLAPMQQCLMAHMPVKVELRGISSS